MAEAEARVEVEVLRRADLGPVWCDDLLPPGAVAVRDAGFTPLEDVTGHQGAWRLWPEAHRRSVPETRPEWLTENDVGQTDGRYWLVRSPWPGLTVVDVPNVLWRETERGLAPEDYDADDGRLADVAHRVFGLDEDGLGALLPVCRSRAGLRHRPGVGGRRAARAVRGRP
ncbi:hypothetical protein GCM10025864_13130 [Luteimicrobium album]|uniref:Uncharacterized protein n=1 Tax=Luteimicrobium album TaxID=1054550 RepID=A0ABQ6I199_9MICO|nr:hypothetical protein GCM10025864_13130 [Luteimicrobium album]